MTLIKNLCTCVAEINLTFVIKTEPTSREIGGERGAYIVILRGERGAYIVILGGERGACIDIPGDRRGEGAGR